MAGGNVVGVWTPSLESYETAFNAGAGRYALIYCGGAAGYLALLGTDAMGPDKPSSTGFFSVWETMQFIYGAHAWPDSQWLPPWNVLALSYGKSGGFFADGNYPPSPPFSAVGPKLSQLPGDLFYDPADEIAGATDAQNRMNAALRLVSKCNIYKFHSDGSVPVSMQFTAPLYKHDDWPTSPPGLPGYPTESIRLAAGFTAPKFALVNLIPLFSPTTSCGFGSEGSSEYVINLSFRNDADFDWSGTAELSGVTVTSGQGQSWSVGPHAETHVSFAVSSISRGETVHLKLLDDIGEIQTLTYDLTPIITSIDARSDGTSFVDSSRNRLSLTFNGYNGYPFFNLTLQVASSGGITGIFDPFSGAALPNPWNTGDSLNCSAPANGVVIDISTATHHPPSVVLAAFVSDNGAPSSMPAFVVTVPLQWT